MSARAYGQPRQAVRLCGSTMSISMFPCSHRADTRSAPTGCAIRVCLRLIVMTFCRGRPRVGPIATSCNTIISRTYDHHCSSPYFLAVIGPTRGRPLQVAPAQSHEYAERKQRGLNWKGTYRAKTKSPPASERRAFLQNKKNGGSVTEPPHY